MIISFLNQKGGVGKTTLAFNTASYFSKERNILVVDADPQQSLVEIALDSKLPINCESNLDYDLTSYLQRNKLNYDLVIVDSGGFDDNRFRSILMNSDFIIIPLKPSPIDVKSVIKNVVSIFLEARELGYSPIVLFVFNMVKKSSKLESFIRNFILQNTEHIDNIFLLDAYLSDSVDYQYSILEGSSILESKTTKEDIKNEFLRFMKELQKGIGE